MFIPIHYNALVPSSPPGEVVVIDGSFLVPEAENVSKGQIEANKGHINPTNEEFISYLIKVFGERMAVHMYQIALCESGECRKAGSFRQWDEDGNLVIHKNKNGSIDRGIFQLNTIHDKDFKKLGLDVEGSWKDNVLGAKHVFDKQTARAWMALERI